MISEEQEVGPVVLIIGIVAEIRRAQGIRSKKCKIQDFSKFKVGKILWGYNAVFPMLICCCSPGTPVFWVLFHSFKQHALRDEFPMLLTQQQSASSA